MAETILVKRIQTEDGIGQVDYESLANLPVIDNMLKTDSANAVQNKVVATAFNNINTKVDTVKNELVSGDITVNNSTNFNGQPASYYAALNTQGISTYTHSKSGTVHNLTGSGNNGKVKMTANVSAGDTFTVNGQSVSAYMGADSAASAMNGDSYNGRWISFTYDGGQINFNGGSSSKFMPKAGGTFSGNVYFANNSSYKFDTYGDITARNINAAGNITGNTIYGAVFNDYAEWFERGEDTEPGDIIALDTSNSIERYIKADINHSCVVGVHSNEYSHIIGGKKYDTDQEYFEQNLKNYIPVGLAGRVKTKVIGPAHKGDRIVVTNIPGVGAASSEKTGDYVGMIVDVEPGEGIRFARVLLK